MTRAGTLSRVITSCGGICCVTVRRLTRTMPVDERNQQHDARPLLVEQASEPEDDAPLVLAQDAHRRRGEDQAEQQQNDDYDYDDDRDDHGLNSHCSALRTRKVRPLTRSTTTRSPSCSSVSWWIGLGSARHSEPSRKTCWLWSVGRADNAHVSDERLSPGARAVSR